MDKNICSRCGKSYKIEMLLKITHPECSCSLSLCKECSNDFIKFLSYNTVKKRSICDPRNSEGLTNEY